MEFWEIAFINKWATVADLRLAVYYNDLSIEEFERITGEKY